MARTCPAWRGLTERDASYSAPIVPPNHGLTPVELPVRTYELQRPEILSHELERRGMSASKAESFAWLLVARQPFAQRIGVPSLTRELERRGLDPEAAHSAALMLVALDLLDGGHLFPDVVRRIARFDRTGQGAHAEALEAAQMHRRLRSRIPFEEPVALRRRLEMVGLGIAAVLLVACLIAL